MPQPIVYTNDSLAKGIESAGTAIAEGITERAKAKKEEKKLKSASDIVSKFTNSNMDANSMSRMQSELANAGIDLGTSSNLIKAYAPLIKDRMMQQGSQAILNKYGIPGMSQQPLQASSQQQPAQIDESRFMQGIGQNIPQQQMGLQQPLSPVGAPTGNPQVQQQALAQQAANAQQMAQPQSYQQVDEQVANQFSQIPSSELSVLGRDPRYKPFVDWELKRRGEEIKVGVNEQAQIRKEDRKKIDTYAAPYADVNKIETQVNKIKKAKELIQNGRVSLDQAFWRNSLAALAGGESHIPQLIKNEDQKKLYSLMADFFNTKSIGGSNPSTREVLIAMQKYPDEYKGKETNEFIINNMLNEAEAQLFKSKEIRNLQKTGKSIPYGQFQERIEDATSRFTKQNEERNQQMAMADKAKSNPAPTGYTWMQIPDGTVKAIPTNSVKQAQQQGAKLLNGK